MKQKLTVTVLLAALVLTLAPVSARADWVKTSGGTKYEKGGSYVTGFAEIDGSYYYFDMNGIMQTGIVKMSDGSLYCFDSKTGEAEEGWVNIGSDKYYADEDGELATGLVQIGSAVYYFGSDGRMARKTLIKNPEDGYKYFLKKNGKAAKNRWVTYEKQYYYVGSDFRVVTDDYVDGYYVDAEGVRGGSAVAKEGDDLSHSAVEEDVVDYGDTTGADIAEYAVQFVGNPYVYGGTSLTNGADCSGFAFAVFKHFGISLLRTANEQMKGPSQAQISSGYTSGFSVAKADLQPGDLVFYGASGYSSHVAIYIGNDEVVHAVNSQTGIKITSITYTGVPIKYMRYWS